MTPKQEFEQVVFNQITITRIGEIYTIQETMQRKWEIDHYVEHSPSLALLPASIGKQLMQLLVEQIKFQNKIVEGLRDLTKAANQRCTYINSDPDIGEFINCKL